MQNKLETSSSRNISENHESVNVVQVQTKVYISRLPNQVGDVFRTGRR